MKKDVFSHAFLGLASLICLSSLSGCSSADDSLTLRLLNCEDYIGEDPFIYQDQDDETETEFASVLEGFQELESARLGKKVKIVYDTYDTNETMLSSLKTGKTSYDLIVASDYTIQKMMTLGMLQALDFAKVPNYTQYASPYLIRQLDGISAEIDGVPCSLGDYSVGYMWGTLGILYNPAKVASDKGMDEDEVKLAMNEWGSLWEDRFYGEMSVKDSMRDTYSVGIMKEFEQDILSAMEESGCFDENLDLIEGKWDEAVKTYSPKLAEIFNRCNEENVEKVKNCLLALKKNIFGFEVDSGKEDIVKGMIGMNLAWSGDAVYSIETAEEPEFNPQYLYYSIPKTGGNIWFDGWMMTKDCQGERKDLAYDFLNYLSDPQIASANMDFIGYTPFIAGPAIHELVYTWYDPRSEEYYGEEGTPWTESDYLGATIDGTTYTWEEIAEEYEWSVVDLTYMFKGTLDVEEEFLGDTPSSNPYLFYTDELEEISVGEEHCIAGRGFMAQYPSEEIIPKLAIMKDYGENNKYVLAMWQDVKANNLPLAGVIVFGIILVTLSAFIIASMVAKRRFRAIRVARSKTALKRSQKK